MGLVLRARVALYPRGHQARYARRARGVLRTRLEGTGPEDLATGHLVE